MKKQNFIKLSALFLALVFMITPAVPPLTLTANASARGNMTDGEIMELNRERQAAAKKSSAPAENANAQSTVFRHSAIKSAIAKAAATNPDVKGWLVVPNTNISKPIVQNTKDNYYYTHRTLGGTDYPQINYQNFVETATYLDYRAGFGETWKKGTSRNTVIYGHNWTNLREPVDVGSNNNHIMFGQLPSYTDLNFAKDNPHIYFSTNELEGIWRVFCVAYVELSTDFNYNSPNPNDESYMFLLDEFKKRSMHNFDVDLVQSDRILTLSTCTRQYNAGAEQRFIVVARLLREGESEHDAVNVIENPNFKKPVFNRREAGVRQITTD